MPPVTDKQEMSVADIAAQFIMPKAPEGSPNEGNGDQQTSTDDASEHQQDDAGQNIADGQGADDDEYGFTDDPDMDAQQEAGDDTGDGEENEADADDDTDFSYLDVTDDDVIPVMIDGKEEYRSVGELKQALSHVGAAENRLREATEARTSATALRTRALEDGTKYMQQLQHVLNTIDQEFANPTIQKPSEQLKASNPDAYWSQRDAYDQEQQRLQQSRAKVQKAMQEAAQYQDQMLDNFKREQAERVVELIPALKDPKKGKQVMDAMVATAREYGFNDDEIKMAADSRYYHLVHDAMMYRKAKGGSKVNDKEATNVGGQKRKVQRVMRSGGTSAKTRAKQQSKEAEAAKKRAAATGSPKDIAAFIRSPR